jgi:CysZ protein
MTAGPLTGARCLWRGLGLLTAPGIRRFVVIPLLINTLLFAGVIVYGYYRLDALIERLLPGWLSWLSWLLWPLLGTLVALVVFYSFTLVANLIGAPFNGLLAEAVERRAAGSSGPPDIPWSQVMKTALPMIWSELRKLLYFLIRALPLLILLVIPGVNVIAAPLWLLFSAWMLALEYLDYPLGNHGLLFAKQREILRRQRLPVLGFGGAVLLLTLIPVVNFLAMPAAVCGATLLWQEYIKPSLE